MEMVTRQTRYRALLKRYGPTAQGMGWANEATQHERWKVMAKDIRGKSLLDVGCGAGRFIDWLPEKDHEYCGIDTIPEMIEHAQVLYPHRRFEVADVREWTEEADTVIASGVLTPYRYTTALAIVERLFSLCRHVAMANFLCSCCGRDFRAGELHVLPSEILNDIRYITPRYSLRHDYGLQDFTIFLYKLYKP